MYSVSFVCSGNICRSPMAEIVFRDRLTVGGLEELVDSSSAGIGNWHVGDPADPRAAAVLAEAGYEVEHVARQFETGDFAHHDLVVALDEGHERELRARAPTRADADQSSSLILTYLAE